MSRLRTLADRFPRRTLWALVFAFAFQCVVFSGSRIFTAAWPHRDMTSALDRAVPFWPWTVSIYVAAYFFWAANYNLAMFQGEDRAWRFLAADILGKAVCLGFFLAMPTANVRPELPPKAPLGWMLHIIYALDSPDNLFPSIHCLDSWLCWAVVRGRKNIPAAYRAFSLVMALAIAASTLTTRQHVLADAAAGFALAELCWQLAGRTGLAAGYRRIWEGPQLR